MADVSDVVNTITGLCAGLIYPNGTGSSSPSVCGVDAYVYPGWPVPAQFESAVANKRCIVSVYPWAGERNTTRYLQKWRTANINTPTLTLTPSGLTATIAGTIPPSSNPHHVCIFVNKFPYVYAVQPTDTLVTVMTALAALISAVLPGVTQSGPSLTVPATAILGACRVGVTGTGNFEIKRQEKQFRIIIWADSPGHRAALAKVLDPGLSRLTFINLPDFTSGRIRYHSNTESDAAQKQLLYRRDLIYTVEYGTVDVATYSQITQFVVIVENENQSPRAWGADSTTVTMDSTVYTVDSVPTENLTFYE